MEVVDLFPRKLLKYLASPEEVKAIQQEFLSNIREIEQLLQPNTFGDNVTTTFNSVECLLSKFNLNFTKNLLLKKAEKFISLHPGLEGQKIKRTQSWINYNGPGSFQNNHVHGFRSISGCLYLKTNGQDGNILFSPGYAEDMFMGVYEVTPEVGLMLLFHSSFPHGVRYNKTQNLRVSLSFNFDY